MKKVLRNVVLPFAIIMAVFFGASCTSLHRSSLSVSVNYSGDESVGVSPLLAKRASFNRCDTGLCETGGRRPVG